MKKLLADYGMVLVLIALCALFSVLTLKKQSPYSEAAAIDLVLKIKRTFDRSDVVLAVGGQNKPSAAFAGNIGDKLKAAGFSETQIVVGTPTNLLVVLDELKSAGRGPAVIATSGSVPKWRVIENMDRDHPEFANCQLMVTESYYWPAFLDGTNLLAIVDRIVVIAVIAIGMTMVIITAGIDLSVGSLMALSAVIAALMMKKVGGPDAAAWTVAVGFLVGMLACGIVGALGGALVARFKVPPFITTLGFMLMVHGLAFEITGGNSIGQLPEALTVLGQGRSLGIPNTVILLVVLYASAHFFMAYTKLGRYIYAVGGNEEAARLSGVPVKFVIIFVYLISGLAAGLGGCIQASQLGSGDPNIGRMYELYVIAAVVVGGTSLAGGSGRILGTLIGAFIISVIQNGLNHLGVNAFRQEVVLGAVIVGAVLLDSGRWRSSN